MLRAQPTDPALPMFYLGGDIRQPTLITDGSTVHVVLAHGDTRLPAVVVGMRAASSSRSYLLVDIHQDIGATVALHYCHEHTDVKGHQHVLRLSESIANVRAEYSDHSESSIGQDTELLLAASELPRFGLKTGTLAFEGTRTVQVWCAHPTTPVTATPVTRVFVQTGVHCYLWMHWRADAKDEHFSTLDGGPSVTAW